MFCYKFLFSLNQGVVFMKKISSHRLRPEQAAYILTLAAPMNGTATNGDNLGHIARMFKKRFRVTINPMAVRKLLIKDRNEKKKEAKRLKKEARQGGRKLQSGQKDLRRMATEQTLSSMAKDTRDLILV